MGTRRVFITSATGALSTRTAPVGGGVAVLEALYPHLASAPDLDVCVLHPGASGGERELDGLRRITLPLACLAGHGAAELLELDARAYGRFALEWERSLAQFFERQDPTDCVVVAKDVSEGPPFESLARRGFAQVVIYHVVVGEFFARQYLRSGQRLGLSAATAARLWRAAARAGLTRLGPRLLSLVWDKEAQAARHAEAIVPSRAMARELVELYPDSRIAMHTEVLPWGVIGAPDAGRRAQRTEVLSRLGLDPARFVLLTLSRISREKRLELLVSALSRLEREAPEMADGLAIVVAGAPAYMGGAQTFRRLRRAAGRLRRVQVCFAGYLADSVKWDALACADLFCSSSSYEAYGLSIAQALASGTPVLATDHQGARAILEQNPALGRIVRANGRSIAEGLRASVAEASDSRRVAAAAWGDAHGFEHAAQRLLARLRGARLRPESASRETTRATR